MTLTVRAAQLFPMNSYDLSGEFGRSSFDIRHRFTIFGTVNLPWWKVVLNPFVIANTGPGFNITTGQDRNLDRQFNERPSFAGPNADCSRRTIRCTRFGNFNLEAAAGRDDHPAQLRPSAGFFCRQPSCQSHVCFRHYQQGQCCCRKAGRSGKLEQVVQVALRSWAVAAREPRLLDQAHKVVVAAAPSEKRFNLNVSINFQNLLNHVNLRYAGRQLVVAELLVSRLGLGGAFGGFGGAGGGSTGAGNRRIYAQVRLNF